MENVKISGLYIVSNQTLEDIPDYFLSTFFKRETRHDPCKQKDLRENIRGLGLEQKAIKAAYDRDGKSMSYMFNETGSEVNSPNLVTYELIGRPIGSIDSIIQNQEFDPRLIVISHSLGAGYERLVRERVIDYARSGTPARPIIIYMPEMRDKQELEKKYLILAEEWNADFGVVPGDAQWDGTMGVIGSQFGFMGQSVRDKIWEDYDFVREAAAITEVQYIHRN